MFYCLENGEIRTIKNHVFGHFSRSENELSKTPSRHYLLKVNNRNTRTRCEICPKLTIKTPERCLAIFCCLYY